MEIPKSEINLGDVQIVDRQYLEPDQINRSFYHELIRNCAEKLEANSDVIQPATRMVDIVAKKRQGRFVFCHHVQDGTVRFFLLSREEAIAKLGSDLTKRVKEMNKKVPKTTPIIPVQPPAAKPTAHPVAHIMSGCNSQHRYAMRMVLKVCMAEADVRSKKTPLDAARILNNPLLPEGEVESLKQRKLRMQLRLRFLAVARTEKSIFIYARNLLRGWGIELSWKKHLMISAIPGFKFEKDEQGFPKSMQPAFLPERKPQSIESSSDSFRTGPWNQEERLAFVRLVDKHGWGRWSEFTQGIPTRYAKAMSREQHLTR